MKITFLGQGFESSSVDAIGNYLIQYLNRKDFHSFTGISAFATEAGIFGLSGHIQIAKSVFKNLSFIVGIDQEGTSKEALEEILNLNIDSYIFYQSEAPIFHPKIYLFEGDKETKLIVGSSNLTGRGLFTNVESSLLIEFDNTDKEGCTLLTNLKTYYKTLFDYSDNNLFKISQIVINDFNARGIVPDEIERRRIYNTKKVSTTPATTLNTNAIAVPVRRTAKIPANFPAKPPASATSSTQHSITITPPVKSLQTARAPIVPQASFLVWEKPSLSKSDARQVTPGSTTKITGNLKLTQAGFHMNNIIIDQTTYFRNQIFNQLAWGHPRPNDNSYEEAYCTFDITILGNPIGFHNLKLSHKPSRVSGQGNVPTWLHWGNTVKPFLHQYNVTGKTLSLYQTGQNFSIEIV